VLTKNVIYMTRDNSSDSSNNQVSNSESEQVKPEQPSLIRQGNIGDAKSDGSDRLIDWKPEETKSKG
jgi:hypothetical protein